MKKLFVLAFALLISTGIQAQLKYQVGAKAGANITTQTTTGAAENVNTNWKAGFNAGVFGNFFFTSKMAGQLEILVSQKGSKWNDPSFSGKDNLTYIDLPILFRFQIIDLINVHAGPQFSFLVDAKSIWDDGEKEDASTWYKNSDVGIVVGAEINLWEKINVTIRFTEGLSVTTTSVYYIDPWKNRVIQVSIGYTILSKSLEK